MAVKDKNKMADIVEWDVENWSKAIGFWDAGLKNKDLTGKKVLDLGGRNGGGVFILGFARGGGGLFRHR